MNLWYIVKVNFVWGPSFIAPSLQNDPSNKQKSFYLHGGLGSGLAGISVNKMTEVNISVKTQTRPSTLWQSTFDNLPSLPLNSRGQDICFHQPMKVLLIHNYKKATEELKSWNHAKDKQYI